MIASSQKTSMTRARLEVPTFVTLLLTHSKRSKTPFRELFVNFLLFIQRRNMGLSFLQPVNSYLGNDPLDLTCASFESKSR